MFLNTFEARNRHCSNRILIHIWSALPSLTVLSELACRLQIRSDWLFSCNLWNLADAIRSTGGHRSTWYLSDYLSYTLLSGYRDRFIKITILVNFWKKHRLQTEHHYRVLVFTLCNPMCPPWSAKVKQMKVKETEKRTLCPKMTLHCAREAWRDICSTLKPVHACIHPETVPVTSNRLGVWLHLVNTVWMGAGHMLCHALPIFINEGNVRAQQMPTIASSCKIKFLTVLFFSVNPL